MGYNLDQMFGISVLLQVLGPLAIVIAIMWSTITICNTIKGKQ